jgi:hypothetical protein
MPHIDKVAGQGARGEEDHVDADIIAILHVTRREDFGSSGDAAEAIIVNRMVKFGGSRAVFDFDKGDNACAAGDEINFTGGSADAFAQDFPALQPEPRCRKAFGAAASRFGGLSLHAFISSARA